MSPKFSSSSTAEEVTEGIDGTGLTAIVTGASSGIGTETTRVLALRGVHVIMAVRNVNAGNKVKNSLIEEIPTAKIDVMEIDLSSMASVRKFGSEFVSLGLPLNILINNAGVLDPKFALSQDNIELHFATNHLGHFLLTNLLLDVMKNTASQTHIQGRIVILTSIAMNYFTKRVRFDKIDENTWNRYGVSKLANVLHANELSRQLKEEGAQVIVNSLHPGLIYTKIHREYGILTRISHSDFLLKIANIFMKNIHQGAATTCYLALNPKVKDVSGKYFEDCKISKPPVSHTKDVELGKELWDISLRLTNSSTIDHGDVICLKDN